VLLTFATVFSVLPTARREKPLVARFAYLIFCIIKEKEKRTKKKHLLAGHHYTTTTTTFIGSSQCDLSRNRYIYIKYIRNRINSRSR
jgi:hypothetical protein